MADVSPTPRQAGRSGLVGGLLWALTPLRQPVFGAGENADQGETFFRLYNVALMVIGVLLTVALLGLRDLSRSGKRSAAIGWWTILAGQALTVAGSVPAVILGDTATAFVMGGQDLGFLGAMIAALGAFILGLSALRQRRPPRLAFWLFLLTFHLDLSPSRSLPRSAHLRATSGCR